MRSIDKMMKAFPDPKKANPPRRKDPHTISLPEERSKPVWRADPFWAGETIFILGGGPSLALVNYELIKGRKIIGVNNAYGDPVIGADGKAMRYEPRDWVQICFFGDERWHEWHRRDLKKFRGEIVACGSKMHGKIGGRVKGLIRGKSEGLEERRNFLAWNKSSGGCAVSLAYHLGAKRVVLLGYDMRRVEIEHGVERANWHEDHPAPNKDPYHRFLLPWPQVKKDADRLGMEIINCTPGSALKIFRIMTLEEYIDYEKIPVA